jgi:hypothetical protein
MRSKIVGLVAVGLLMVSGPVTAQEPEPKTRAALDKVRVGMTAAEVTKTVGGPPGDYTTRPIFGNRQPGDNGRDQWMCDDGWLLVTFRNGRAVEVAVRDVAVGPPLSLWEKLRLRFGQ